MGSGDNANKIVVGLEGVSETLLWPLYNRAAESRRADSRLKDATAVKLAESIDYPFEDRFGKPDEMHVLRALRFDDQVRLYLETHPDATVVALGEGLETQFWRVDNGRVKWLAVDMPAVIDVRTRLLPQTDRNRYLACSALDLKWMEEVDPSQGVFVTAQGLLMYFDPAEVRRLVAACADRFRDGRMLFDVIPRWYSEQTLRGYNMTKSYQTPKMPFGLDVNELPGIRSYHPKVIDVREIPPGRGRSYHFRYKIPVMSRLPWFGNRRTSFALVTFSD